MQQNGEFGPSLSEAKPIPLTGKVQWPAASLRADALRQNPRWNQKFDSSLVTWVPSTDEGALPALLRGLVAMVHMPTRGTIQEWERRRWELPGKTESAGELRLAQRMPSHSCL